MAGQIVKRGDRRYLIRVYLGRDPDTGKRKYRSQTIHGTKKEAGRKLRKLLTSADNGKLPIREIGTVDDYLDVWLDTVAKPSVRARTLDDYTATLRNYVRPHVGGIRLAKLSPANVRAMLVTLREQGYAPRTVRKARECLRNALEHAVAEGHIPDNPSRGRLVAKALPPKEQTERRTLASEDVGAFLEAASEDRLAAYWIVMLFGGFRPSEALALRWQDVDLDSSTVQVRRVLVDKAGDDWPLYAPPKSEQSRRAVVLPRVAVGALRDHRRRQLEERLAADAAWEDPELVFTAETGGALRQHMTWRAWHALLGRAGLPTMRIYDLRHSCASLLLESGESLKVVSERLGHSTITLTADVYAHVNRGQQEAAAAKLDRLARGGERG